MVEGVHLSIRLFMCRQLAKIAREKGQIDRACNLLGDACEITCNREGTDTCKAMAAVLFDFG